MIEKILVLILPLLFLGFFIARNLIVKARAVESIRSQDRLVTSSIILSTLCILVTILSVYSEPFYHVFQHALYPAQPFAAGVDPGRRYRLP
jgi:multisubunit Na+/H+ antiporter MnhF subunit